MKQSIYGRGIEIKKVAEAGIVASDKKYYTLMGIDPRDFEEAGIRVGSFIKGTIVSNESGDSTFYHIEGWSLSGGDIAEPEAIKEEIRRKKKA